MRCFITLLLFATIHCVQSKNNVKSLTESLGQEVIEIGTPIKELPPDLEEEPSAENDEEDLPSSIQPVVTKETKKTATLSVSSTVDTRRKYKDQDKTTTSKQDDEEARIEKELAEIYKDNIDYKADSSEVIKDVTTVKVEEFGKPIARAKPKSFKFQPDMNNKAEVERFRTSIDEISCDQRNVLKKETTASPDSASENSVHYIFCLTLLISALIFN